MCLNPITIERYNEEHKDKETIQVSCGKCIQCQIKRIKNWTSKLYLETISHEESCFITLTFDNNKITNTNDKELTPLMACDLAYSKRYFQLFMKRLRKHIQKYEGKLIKFYHIGEYGALNQRAHHHVIIFGWKPNDMRIMENSKSGKPQYHSKLIDNKWKLGRTSVQNTNINNIKYITKYTTEKILNTNNYNTNMHKPYQTFSNRGRLGELMLHKLERNLLENDGFEIDNTHYPLSMQQIKKIKEINEHIYKKTEYNFEIIKKCELLMQEKIEKAEEYQNSIKTNYNNNIEYWKKTQINKYISTKKSQARYKS